MENDEIDSILNMLAGLVEVTEANGRKTAGTHMQAFHNGETSAYRGMFNFFQELREENARTE